MPFIELVDPEGVAKLYAPRFGVFEPKLPTYLRIAVVTEAPVNKLPVVSVGAASLATAPIVPPLTTRYKLLAAVLYNVPAATLVALVLAGQVVAVILLPFNCAPNNFTALE